MRLWLYNNIIRHWHSTALWAWLWGVPQVKCGKITQETIDWAKGHEL